MFGFAKKLVSTIETQATNYLSNSTISDETIDEDQLGLRVINVIKNSISEKHGLESWFDFIIEINGYDIMSLIATMKTMESASNPFETNQIKNETSYSNLLNFLNHEVVILKSDLEFTIFSAKGNIKRKIKISNSEFEIVDVANKLDEIKLNDDDDDYDHQNTNTTAFKKLGVSLELTPIKSSTFVWHVLRVHPNSPAYLAGIMPDEYIIQANDGKLATGGEDLLSRLIVSIYAKNGENSEIVLYVYNHDFDIVRPVTIKINNNWGNGKSLLGCDVGYGLLHRIPEVIGKYINITDVNIKKNSNEVQFNHDKIDFTPGSVVFDSESSEILKPTVKAPLFDVDTQLDDTEIASKNVLNIHRKNKSVKNNNNLQDYFDEQTKISKQLDGNNSNQVFDNIPLPPKINK